MDRFKGTQELLVYIWSNCRGCGRCLLGDFFVPGYQVYPKERLQRQEINFQHNLTIVYVSARKIYLCLRRHNFQYKRSNGSNISISHFLVYKSLTPTSKITESENTANTTTDTKTLTTDNFDV